MKNWQYWGIIAMIWTANFVNGNDDVVSQIYSFIIAGICLFLMHRAIKKDV